MHQVVDVGVGLGRAVHGEGLGRVVRQVVDVGGRFFTGVGSGICSAPGPVAATGSVRCCLWVGATARWNALARDVLLGRFLQRISIQTFSTLTRQQSFKAILQKQLRKKRTSSFDVSLSRTRA